MSRGIVSLPLANAFLHVSLVAALSGLVGGGWKPTPAIQPARDQRPAQGSPAPSGRTTGQQSFLGVKGGDEREAGGIRLRWCPPGRFLMGSPPMEAERRPDETQAVTKLTRGFWAGQYEVTQGQWKRVMGSLPGELTAGGGRFPGLRHEPCRVRGILLQAHGETRASGDLPDGWEFRLPTEAQWEYACRAGITTATAFGDVLSSEQANFQGKPYNGAPVGPSLHRTARVGSYPANSWGLHDFHGNVFEWCRDWYHGKLPGSDDPDMASKGTMNRDGTSSRVRRGGCWADDGWPCRSAFRAPIRARAAERPHRLPRRRRPVLSTM